MAVIVQQEKKRQYNNLGNQNTLPVNYC